MTFGSRTLWTCRALSSAASWTRPAIMAEQNGQTMAFFLAPFATQESRESVRKNANFHALYFTICHGREAGKAAVHNLAGVAQSYGYRVALAQSKLVPLKRAEDVLTGAGDPGERAPVGAKLEDRRERPAVEAPRYERLERPPIEARRYERLSRPIAGRALTFIQPISAKLNVAFWQSKPSTQVRYGLIQSLRACLSAKM
jgi:hypothetical protein